MLVVSTKDTEYLLSRFPGNSIHYIPSFHGNNRCKSITGKGKYVLYHGNLSVAENSRAAEFLIKEVFNGIEVPLVIAGLKPSYRLKKLASDHGVQLIEDPAEELMEQLIREAHLNILVTFQETGLKLKLLNTLYLGRFVLVNKAMLAGTGLESLCSLAESPQDFQTAILSLFSKEFDESIIAERENILKHLYSDEENARKIINLIF